MQEHISKAWVTKKLGIDEVKAYSNLQDKLEQRLSPEQKKSLEQSWADLISSIASHLQEDPAGKKAQVLAKRCIDLSKDICGTEHAKMRAALWQKGFGKSLKNLDKTPQEILNWIDKALDAYWKTRIYELVYKENLNQKEVSKAWEQILDDMCGDDQSEKDGVIKATLSDNKIDSVAKDWLRKNYNL